MYNVYGFIEHSKKIINTKHKRKYTGVHKWGTVPQQVWFPRQLREQIQQSMWHNHQLWRRNLRVRLQKQQDSCFVNCFKWRQYGQWRQSSYCFYLNSLRLLLRLLTVCRYRLKQRILNKHLTFSTNFRLLCFAPCFYSATSNNSLVTSTSPIHCLLYTKYII